MRLHRAADQFWPVRVAAVVRALRVRPGIGVDAPLLLQPGLALYAPFESADTALAVAAADLRAGNDFTGNLRDETLKPAALTVLPRRLHGAAESATGLQTCWNGQGGPSCGPATAQRQNRAAPPLRRVPTRCASRAPFRALAMAVVWGGAAGDDCHCVGHDVSKVTACTGSRVSAVADLLFQYENLKHTHLLELHLGRLAHIVLFR